MTDPMPSRCKTTMYFIKAIIEKRILDPDFDPTFVWSIEAQINEKGWVSRRQAMAVHRIADKYRVLAETQADN